MGDEVGFHDVVATVVWRCRKTASRLGCHGRPSSGTRHNVPAKHARFRSSICSAPPYFLSEVVFARKTIESPTVATGDARLVAVSFCAAEKRGKRVFGNGCNIEQPAWDDRVGFHLILTYCRNRITRLKRVIRRQHLNFHYLAPKYIL